MPKAGTGLAGELGFKRRDNPTAYKRAWRQRNREQNNEYQRRYYHEVTKKCPKKRAAKNKSGAFARRKAKYGISREEYDFLLTEQDGRCKICFEKVGEELRVDHDHETGKIRALLCAKCNSGIGLLKEDPDVLRLAAQYIEKHHPEKAR